MNTISFMTANYVARQVGYHMTDGWMQGDSSTRAHFAPVETFPARFEAYLTDIKALGFDALDLWLAILPPSSEAAKVEAAAALLRQHGLTVTSFAGDMGATRDEFVATSKLAHALGTRVVGGWGGLLAQDRASGIAILDEYDMRLGVENHPEKTPQELITRIGGESGGRVGAAVDTGWFGTQGYDAADALEALRDYLVVVHLKDVRATGGHDTCALGDGVVPIQRCVETLKRIGYTGSISIEHEPNDYDPSEECRQSRIRVEGWLS
jgi:L-ribulose-5-phosphate 3-epimerase